MVLDDRFPRRRRHEPLTQKFSLAGGGFRPHNACAMNSLERYLSTIEGKPVDHLARLPILMQFAAEFIGSNYGAFASDYRVLTEANFVCNEHFGIDQMNTMSDPYRETQGFGAKIIYEKNMVPHCEKHPLEDDPDLSKLARPNPLEAERMHDRIEAVRTYRERAGGQFSIMGWVEGPAAEATDLRRMDNFFMDLVDDEEYVGALMDLCVDVALDFAKAQVEAGADTIGVGDAAASQVSPDLYEELILPRQQRLVRGLKDMGAKVRLHICGNITHLLPGIASLDLDVLDVDHMVDLPTVREAVGPRTVIAGNIDPVAAVLRSNPGAIRRAVLDCYEQCGNPFMVNAGCEIPSGTPNENLKALCEPIAWKA
jgi:MtaA/CmuA family methyltransferase